jgi:hypothetical protein
MMRWTHRAPRFTWSLAALAILRVSPARAEAESGAVAVGYVAAPECPARGEFEIAVLSRAPTARIVERSEATLVFDAEITSGPDGFAGVLWVGLPDGTRARRDVIGASCAEVVATLSVIVALSIEGHRVSLARAPEPPGEKPALNESGATAESTAALAAKPEPAPVVNPTAPAPPRDAEQAGAATARVGLGAYAAAIWENAAAPSAPFGGLFGVEVAAPRRGVVWLRGRLGFLFTASASASEPNGQAAARFRLLAGRLALCPLAFGAAGGASAHLCAEFDGGALRGEATTGAVQNPEPQVMPWLAAGLAARGEVALGSWLSLEGTAGARFLARNDRFVFERQAADGSALDPASVYDVPVFSTGLGVGLSARLP